MKTKKISTNATESPDSIEALGEENRRWLKKIHTMIRNEFNFKCRHVTIGKYELPYRIRPTVPTPSSPVTIQLEFAINDNRDILAGREFYGAIRLLRDAKGRYFITRGNRVDRELSIGEAVSIATRWGLIDGLLDCPDCPEEELNTDIGRVLAAGIRAIGQDVPSLADIERLIC